MVVFVDGKGYTTRAIEKQKNCEFWKRGLSTCSVLLQQVVRWLFSTRLCSMRVLSDL